MIYIVRHGQTKYNVEGRYGGRIDIPLNNNGIKSAKELRDKFKNVKFDYVICSPLIRTQQTAKIITNKSLILDERLIERDNGELEGKLKSEIQELPDFNDPNENKYNIESITNFRNRIEDFFCEIDEKYKGKNVLIVTHAGVGIYARCHYEGEPQNGDYLIYKMKNCAVLEYEN